MLPRFRPLPAVLILPSLLAACGDSSSPTAPAPVIVQAGGTWEGTHRITGVSGGECGEWMQFFVNSTSSVRLTIQQNGTAVTAQTTEPFGATCTLTGSATTTGVSLHSTRCDMPPNFINFITCPTEGREFATRSLSPTLTIAGNSGSGPFNQVVDARSIGGTVTSSTTFTGQLTLTRR